MILDKEGNISINQICKQINLLYFNMLLYAVHLNKGQWYLTDLYIPVINTYSRILFFDLKGQHTRSSRIWMQQKLLRLF